MELGKILECCNSSGATGTGYSFTSTDQVILICQWYKINTEFKFNFGNGYFGTTAVSSAGTNASQVMEYLNMMYQLDLQLYQQKD